MSRIRLVVFSVLTASALAGCSDLALATPPDADVGRSIAELRRATARYHDAQTAIDDGFVATEVCVPGMGLHYVNPARALDPVVDPTRPELLIYEPTAGGRLRLVAMEWFTVDPDQDVATADGRPSLFGVGFDGPMLGHEPGRSPRLDLEAQIPLGSSRPRTRQSPARSDGRFGMRVLFTCQPGFGHFLPMVPLARALGKAGHDVAFATGADFLSIVREAGFFRASPSGSSCPGPSRRR